MANKTVRGGWKASLATLLHDFGPYTTDGKKAVSYATRQARREHLYRVFQDIRLLGFKLQSVKNIKGKHVLALAKHYAERVQQGSLAVATVQNRFSHLRTFSKWIDKPGLVKPLEHYVGAPLKRTTIATHSKAWHDQGKETEQLITEVSQTHPRFGAALRLQRLFGLRSKESMLLRPHLADKGNILIVSHGTKGGRDRFIPIQTQAQRALLNHIKQTVGLNESLVPKGQSYESFRRQYYRTLTKHGICRQQGITAHGLRHEHLNELYENTTGNKTAVRGGDLHKTNPTLDCFGRQLVAERAGHSRESIAGAYVGGKK